jgi:cephalosporin hydroxylase
MTMTHTADSLLVDAALLRQAERRCEERLRAEPENREALRSLAEVYRKQGNLPDRAAAAYERLCQLNPEDREAGYLQALMAGKEWAEAPAGIAAAPFVLTRDFLPRGFHDSLLRFFTSARQRFELGSLSNDWEGKKRFKECFAEALVGIAPRLHQEPIQAVSANLRVRAYQDGHFLKMQRDIPPKSRALRRRVLSFVYFLHQHPRSFEGGQVLLFDSDVETGGCVRERFTTVVPEDNVLVVFPSSTYHCVLPVRCTSAEFADSSFVIHGLVETRPEPELSTTRPEVERFHRYFYDSLAWQEMHWLGTPTLKYPQDLWVYQEILTELRPDLIVECGTYKGGTTLFLATICDALGHGEILTIDPHHHFGRAAHPRIEYFSGGSTEPQTLDRVKARAADAKSVLVILDSDHRESHVYQELTLYAPLVTRGSYLICEDTNVNGHPVCPEHGPGPMEAVTRFLAEHAEFVVDPTRERFMITANPGGYLRKK